MDSGQREGGWWVRGPSAVLVAAAGAARNASSQTHQLQCHLVKRPRRPRGLPGYVALRNASRTGSKRQDNGRGRVWEVGDTGAPARQSRPALGRAWGLSAVWPHARLQGRRNPHSGPGAWLFKKRAACTLTSFNKCIPEWMPAVDENPRL